MSYCSVEHRVSRHTSDTEAASKILKSIVEDADFVGGEPCRLAVDHKAIDPLI